MLDSLGKVLRDAGWDDLVEQCESAKLQISLAKSPDVVEAIAMMLHGAIEDRAENTMFFVVSREDAGLYHRNPFPKIVRYRFPSAIPDMVEAGRCLALDRNTACVFHCMRVCEVVLYSLAAHIGPSSFSESASLQANWDVVIKKIDNELKAAYKDRGDQFKGTYDFFSMTSNHMHALCKALRNDTMHANQSYDRTAAQEVLTATRRFAIYLATKSWDDVNR